MGLPNASRSILREAMSRSTNREGIPMVVALVDERGMIPPVTDQAVLALGAELAAHAAQARRELGESMREGDNGGAITSLLIAADSLTRREGDRG